MTSSQKEYTWSHGESLAKLLERKHNIKEFIAQEKSSLLIDLLDEDVLDDQFCASCHL